MSYRFVVLGNVSTDYFVPAGFRVEESRVVFDRVHPPLTLETDGRIFPGGKLPLRQPVSMRQLGGLGGVIGPGGGGLGTVSSLAAWRSGSAFYVDASVEEDRFTRHFGGLGIETFFMGLRPAPLNVVLGTRDEKVVLKNPVHPVRMSSALRERCRRLAAGAEWAIVNSVKDEDLVWSAIDMVAENPTAKLAAVVTDSLSPEFVRQNVLPSADILIASFDELRWLLPGRPVTTSGSKERVFRLLAQMRSNAHAFITLARDGVICAGAEGLFHVRLREGAARRIQEAVLLRPAALTGAGDWLVGGIIASASAYRWPRMNRYPQVVEYAVAGCTAALAHLGAEVAQEDFEIRQESPSEYVSREAV